MRTLWLLLSLYVAVLTARADISIGVVVPEAHAELSEKHLSLLRTKMLQLLTSAGVSTLPNGGLLLYPELNIVDEQVVEGGLANLSALKLEVTLVLYHFDTQTHFSSLPLSLKGHGKSKAEALRHALAGLSSHQGAFNRFWKESRPKIEEYFEAQRSSLIQRANQLAAMKQYEEALALLWSYPAGALGEEEVLTALLGVYQRYEASSCAGLIHRAKTALAEKAYSAATRELAQVDPEGACAREATQLLASIRQQIQEDQREALELKRLEQLRQDDLERYRIDAIKSIVQSYCTRTQPTYNYSLIVK